MTANIIPFLIRSLTGVKLTVSGDGHPPERPRVYYGNHSSHLDFLLVWAALPKHLREQSRPVGAADYWNANPLRRRLAQETFRALLVERGCLCRDQSPLQRMEEALDGGDSLIIFPEGSRDSGDQLQGFKSGIYHLAKRRPETEFVPVWLEGAFRILPKGEILPIPLLASVTFGAAHTLTCGASKVSFLETCREALLSLRDARTIQSIQ